ncbi:hypothetical protein [Candidatus Cetobacterium colombiensis]|uniref:Uncharacterized protein n=1 Tax=Candidatus Cetobacterium colombiensis TaxID=3073100 RepID=A0ABU4W5Z7_9FUSO|nr:hypothetical protein [Candidatus Cetobacterium colombiensis]MDX8334951.1 hypothetical protein [Candidatus Cetobacterium colombiensis]
MKIKYLLFVLFFCLMDLFLFLYFQKDLLVFRSSFWIGHFVLALLFIYLNNKLLQGKEFDIFILIFPAVGYILLFISSFLNFQKHFESEVEINENLNKYILDGEKEIIVNQSIDLNLIGAYDILSVGTPADKKNFLINFETQDLNFKIEVLQKALWDSDIEVIHYAATEINKIDENFQNIIKEENIKGNLNSLCEVYFKYCTSGLLIGEVLEFYQNKFIDFIKQKDKLNGEDSYKLLVVYNSMKKYKECDELIKRIYKNKSYNKKILDFIKNYYYNLNDYKMLKEVETWQESV